MRTFTIREILPEFQGMKDVIKLTFRNGSIQYHTREYPFAEEAVRVGAIKLNIVDNEFGRFMHFFNSNNETVGVYKMTDRLRGFTKEQLAEQHNKLFFCKLYNQKSNFWETCVDGTPAKVTSYKEGCGLATILKNGHYYVIDKDNNFIVPPGKYDYIDGFDKCGLARVKLDGKADIFNPEKTTYDRWGLIDTKGNEILPLEYSELWAFFNKSRSYTRLYVDDFDEDGNYIKNFEAYIFILPCKDYPKGKLKGPGEWFGNQFQTYEEIDSTNMDYNYSVWDAFEDNEEAASASDFEW